MAQIRGASRFLTYMKLNVGCGPDYRDGWVNVDSWRDDTVKPDIIGSLPKLSFKRGEFDMIYAGHVLEHLTFDLALESLNELATLTAPGGEVCIVGPACEVCLPERDGLAYVRNLFGTMLYPTDYHKWVSTTDAMRVLLRGSDLVDAEYHPFPLDRDIAVKWGISTRNVLEQYCFIWVNKTEGSADNE